MNQKQIKDLLRRYQLGQCSIEEREKLDQWYDSELSKQPPSIHDQEDVETRQRIWNKISNTSGQFPAWLIAIAASVLLISCIIYLNWPQTVPNISMVSTDIAPGGNRAILSLSNGKKVNLSDAKTGIMLNAGSVTYDDGAVVASSTETQTLTTPKGGQYQIVLADGTRIWLNAVSAIRFPADFKNVTQRKVELLNGEIYLEVAKDKKHPFIVVSDQQEIKVLGTQFNINTYSAETKTTLVEGSVRIKSIGNSKVSMLRPGEQAILSRDGIRVKQADVDLEIAWKNGKIEFMDADIKRIMTMLERWYNIEVVYQGKPTATPFTGSVSRSKNISEILNLLASTGDVSFKIEGRRVEVLNK